MANLDVFELTLNLLAHVNVILRLTSSLAGIMAASPYVGIVLNVCQIRILQQCVEAFQEGPEQWLEMLRREFPRNSGGTKKPASM